MFRLLVVKHLIEAAHIDGLPAVLAGVEMLGLIRRLFAIARTTTNVPEGFAVLYPLRERGALLLIHD